MKGSLNPVLHQLADCLRLIGLRDRLRCPKCKAVGTWKPHGGRLTKEERAYPVRRWMCKWCGYYVGPEDTNACAPNPEMGVWSDRRIVKDPKTPAEIVAEHPAHPWPWRG